MSTGAGGYRMGATWENLLPLLGKVGIRRSSCFFTNIYMGLRRGSTTVGQFAGATDAAFVQRCQRFLLTQLSVQRPRVVLTLGAWVPALIAPLSPQLAGWGGIRDFQLLDARQPIIHGVTIPDIGHDGMSVVALTHPSFRRLNVGRRRYLEWEGDAAEEAMIREALRNTGSQLLGALKAGRD